MHDDDDRRRVGEEDLDDLPLSKEDKKAEKKRRKKLEETLETGTPDPWERYRVLLDLLEMYNDISEMADRKTRFALVILGALNTVNVLIAARPELFFETNQARGPWVAVYLMSYVALSLFLFVQAIGALKPRVTTLLTRVESPEGANHKVVGLRFISHIRETEFEEYYEKWRTAQFADINRELALSVKMVVGVVSSKYEALHRLYSGLMVLVFLTAGLVLALLYLRMLAPQS